MALWPRCLQNILPFVKAPETLHFLVHLSKFLFVQFLTSKQTKMLPWFQNAETQRKVRSILVQWQQLLVDILVRLVLVLDSKDKSNMHFRILILIYQYSTLVV